MSYRRRRTLATWIAACVVFAPFVIGPAVLLIARAPSGERIFYAIPLLIPAATLIAIFVIARSDRTVDAALKLPDRVAFATRNVPGAMVYIERFLIEGAAFARGRTFVIVVSDAGISYFSAGKNPVEFVRIPWSEIVGAEELAGELGITLADGNLLLHVPGGFLPVGVTRTREIAAQISAAQRERQL